MRMSALVVASVILLMTGCSAPATPTPSPTPSVTPTQSAMPTPRPLASTDQLSDGIRSYEGTDIAPTFAFTLAGDAGYSENFEFQLDEGTYLLRVGCSTDASDTVLVTLYFGDGRDNVVYDVYCGETPTTGIVSVTTQSPTFAGGGVVTMTVTSESRFSSATGLVRVS